MCRTFRESNLARQFRLPRAASRLGFLRNELDQSRSDFIQWKHASDTVRCGLVPRDHDSEKVMNRIDALGNLADWRSEDDSNDAVLENTSCRLDQWCSR